jgi:hypothetical protein
MSIERPYRNLSDTELYWAYISANESADVSCLKCDGGSFKWDTEFNRWRCHKCNTLQSDKSVELDRIRDLYHEEISWRSVYMQNGDEDSWVSYQESQQHIEKLERLLAECEQGKLNT